LGTSIHTGHSREPAKLFLRLIELMLLKLYIRKVIGITDNVINRLMETNLSDWQDHKTHITPSYLSNVCWSSLLIIITWLFESVWLCPKVFPFSSFCCIKNGYIRFIQTSEISSIPYGWCFKTMHCSLKKLEKSGHIGNQ
jgi:hypothetical protein